MAKQHDSHEWVSLIEVSGPFLAVPVLEKAFPQGLDGLDPNKKRMLRQAYDEWREALELDDPQLPELHRAWVDLVLKQGLELDEDGEGDVLKPVDRLPADLEYRHPDYGVTLRPDYAVVDDQKGDEPMMLVVVHGPDVDLDAPMDDAWAATPAERMAQLCRATETRLGLVTNGERWMLVDAPVGGVTTYASWYARLWAQEPVTLQAFVTLLGIRRFFTAQEEQLPALLDESLQHQDEVTEALGEQVRRAVEVLIQALDKADLDRNRELLRGVEPAELYEAALTVMMRLVFLLSAEERELMDVVKDERFESYYAVSSLRMQLREQAGLHSEEILAHRRDAWSRLLAIFRAVYAGIEHEALRMPALGGSLFDPDRFPFLEGRAKGTSWRTDEARPLPIDNRTVLLLLESIQTFQGRTLSYRALDVENIGYVYEGLLERTVERARTIVLELKAGKDAKKTLYALDELERLRSEGTEALVDALSPTKGLKRSKSAILKDLERPVDSDDLARLLTACHNDQALCDRVAPFYHLLRIDRWDYPLVYPEGAYMVTTGTDRRETGTHYTPKSLTEAIVKETLEPVVYTGPAEGRPREEWALKSPAEMLDLKICDPAMGSGAFLVQVCRWLSERLMEAWERAESEGKAITVDGEVLDTLGSAEPLPTDPEERLITARRLIAERCIYGVDVNPMAVELAKLSIWLVTLAKGRPFGFLDHNLSAGDSLLGIHDLDQIRYLEMDPKAEGSGRKLFAQAIDQAVDDAVELRRKLRRRVIQDIHDVEIMADLDREARRRLELPELIADALVGKVLANGRRAVDTAALSIEVGRAIEGDEEAINKLRRRAREGLSTDLPAGKPPRRPMHWPLEFPEVFGRENGGFDAIVGNPPFLGGQRITGVMGTAYRDWLLERIADGRRGSADLVAYFFLRAWNLLREAGNFGLLAVNTIAEGDTRQVGLEAMVKAGAVVYAAYPNEPWAGAAAVVTSRVHVHKGPWEGERRLNGRSVPFISAFLSDREEWTPKQLKANEGVAFQGSIVLGMGFVLTPDEAKHMLDADPKNTDVIFPYLNGKDLNSDPEQRPSRWVINFWDWPEERAREYELPWKWIEERVKPEREKLKDTNSTSRRRKQYWWQYGSDAKNLYHAIGRGHHFEHHPDDWDPAMKPMERLLAIGRVSKTGAFTFLPNDWVYSDQVVVFALDEDVDISVMQSSIHIAYAWKHSSQLKADMRYTPTDVFETFPFPGSGDRTGLSRLGATYHVLRAEFMCNEEIGLTKFYNCFHDSARRDSHLKELRELHREIDVAVAQAYGWDDLSLGHDFHEVSYLPENDRIRFTISEPARIEVLHRLAQLNKERYEEEVVQGLHPRAKGAKRKTTPKKKHQLAKVYEIPSFEERDVPKAAEPDSPQMDIFTDPSPRVTKSNQWGSVPIDQILAWLEAHPGWHGKAEIVAGSGIDEADWKKAIDELLEEGSIERKGERRGAKYRAMQSGKGNL